MSGQHSNFGSQMRNITIFLALLATSLAIHYYGPVAVDLPITIWKMNGEYIYVASEIGVSVVDTTGRITDNLFVGEWLEDLAVNDEYLVVVTNTSKVLVYTLLDGMPYANLSMPRPYWNYGLLLLKDHFALLSLEKMEPKSRTFVDFYYYNCSFHSSVTQPYVAWGKGVYNHDTVVTSNEIYPANQTWLMFASANGTFNNVLLDKHITLDYMYRRPGTNAIYGTNVGIIEVDGTKVSKYAKSKLLTTAFKFYGKHVVYMADDWQHNYTAYVCFDQDSHNITMHYTPINEYYLSLDISPSGKMVVSMPGTLFIYQLV